MLIYINAEHQYTLFYINYMETPKVHYQKKSAELAKSGMKWTLLRVQDGIKLYDEYRRLGMNPDFEILSSPDKTEAEIWYKDKFTLDLIKKVTGQDET